MRTREYTGPRSLGTGPARSGRIPIATILRRPPGGAMRGPPATPAPQRRTAWRPLGERRTPVCRGHGRGPRADRRVRVGPTGACAWSSGTTRTAGLRRQPDAPASARRSGVS